MFGCFRLWSVRCYDRSRNLSFFFGSIFQSKYFYSHKIILSKLYIDKILFFLSVVAFAGSLLGGSCLCESALCLAIGSCYVKEANLVW